MRIDIISIFPAYLDPLELSLPGKARDNGLLDIRVHDLRAWAHDRHRTVDDSPYGGGAGMVMKPEPWGEALADVSSAGSSPEARPVIVFTTPSGRPFSQAMARELAGVDHLVFACGRYEGIDQRVIDHAATLGEVREISLGDYVLNGGEVAALAITEAVVRLLPGFLGNAESLAEESHEDGLLEYPVYTKPASWRGLDVPGVLLSGDHAAIAEWRRDQAVRRTADRRPDLFRPASVLDLGDLAARIQPATPGDAGELLTLQRACWVQEQQANPGVEIPALDESLADVRHWLTTWATFVVRSRRPVGRGGPRPPRGRRVGHRPDHGGARPPGPRSGPPAPRVRRTGRPAGPHLVRPDHRSQQSRQPTDVQVGRLPGHWFARARRREHVQASFAIVRGRKHQNSGGARCRRPRSIPDFSGRSSAVANLLVGPVGRKDSPEDHTGGPRQSPATGGAGAAGHLDRAARIEL